MIKIERDTECKKVSRKLENTEPYVARLAYFLKN